MKRIINGVVYDTSISKRIGGYHYGIGEYETWEDLYLSPDGHYFLHCRGGTMTPYNMCRNGQLYPGEVILALGKAKGREWEAHLN